MVYYALYIPSRKKTNEDNETLIYKDNEEAMKMLKTYKDARFKKFSNVADAIHFSLKGTSEGSNSSFNMGDRKVLSQTPKNLEKSNFKAPKSQDLIRFRKEIEANNLNVVYQTVWENPKYLVSSGDTPAILKEGPRYNALHTAAISKHAQMCKLILETVEKPHFMELLHGTRSDATEECSSILLESYLNTPDKSRSETPLHFAVKFGALGVVEALIAYPQCKMLPNSEGLYPKDIVCSRLNDPSEELIESISALLRERFFVPVYRSLDNCTPPRIGEPFSPTDTPVFEQDRFSPQLEIKAYAGPMNKDQAIVFGKRWKTPPRILSSPLYLMNVSPIKAGNSLPSASSNLMSTPKSNSKPRLESRRLFSDKSLDNNSDDLPNHTAEVTATPNNVKKSELFTNYRNHLNSSYADDSNNSISFFADMNNSYYDNENIQNSPSYRERELRITDTEKGLEIIGRNLASELNIGWKEYWNFLGTFVDINSDDGLKEFENYLINKKESRSQLNNNTSYKNGDNTNDSQMQKKVDKFLNDSVSDLCNALVTINLNNEMSKQNSSPLKPLISSASLHNGKENVSETRDTLSISPYICIEKSCQVYAKRFAKTMLNNMNDADIFYDTLNYELVRMHKLVDSYRTDERFSNVHFDRIYSRYGHLVASYLKHSADLNVDLENVRDKLNKFEFKKKFLNSTISLICVLNTFEFILKYINNPSIIVNPDSIEDEAKCIDVWSKEEIHNCTCQINSKVRKRLYIKKPEFTANDTNALPNPNHVDITNPSIPKSFSDSTDLKSVCKNDNLWNFRNNNEIPSDCEDDSVSDNDVFFSCASSEDEDVEIEDTPWFTPSQSPVMFSDINEDEYSNFIDGNEPTKQDVNVLNALSRHEIDPLLYPNVNKWKIAMSKYSKEEKETFPSPAIKIKYVGNYNNQVKANNLSPIADIRNKLGKKLSWQRTLNFDSDDFIGKGSLSENMST